MLDRRERLKAYVPFESLQIRQKSPFTITGFWWFAIKTTTVDKFLDILLMPLTCHNKIKCIGTIDITIVCLNASLKKHMKCLNENAPGRRSFAEKNYLFLHPF